MNPEQLKIGSIVRMTYNTYAKNAKENFTIIDTYEYDGEQFITYIADCVVCNVTAKFFQVIIPHSNGKSIKYAKNCFTTTTHSSVDRHKSKPTIVKI